MAIVTLEALNTEFSEVLINYNDNNQRLNDVEWFIAPGYQGHARVWIDAALIYDLILSGTGATNIAGNHQAELVDDGDGGFNYRLPANITYTFEVGTQ